jgi:hypothetical protein
MINFMGIFSNFYLTNFFTHMENELDIFGNTMPTQNNTIPEEKGVSPIVEINNILEHFKSGGQVAIIPNGSKAIIVRQEFNPEIKNKIEELNIELQGVGAIVSQDSAANANSVLKKAKKLITSLSTERKLMTSVLDDEKDSLMRYEEKIVNDLERTVVIINTAITNFQKEELRKQQEREAELKKQRDEELRLAQEEANRKASIQTKILNFEKSVIAACASAAISDIDEKIKILASTAIKEEVYMEFLGEAKIMYQNCVTRMNARKVELMELAELAKKNKEAADKLKQDQEEKHKLEAESHNQKSEEVLNIIEEEKQMEVANSQMGYELKVSSGEKVKGVQQRWTFDPTSIDMALLPEEFKTFDEKKIKEAIAAGAREIAGVRIYQDVINVSR